MEPIVPIVPPVGGNWGLGFCGEVVLPLSAILAGKAGGVSPTCVQLTSTGSRTGALSGVENDALSTKDLPADAIP